MQRAGAWLAGVGTGRLPPGAYPRRLPPDADQGVELGRLAIGRHDEGRAKEALMHARRPEPSVLRRLRVPAGCLGAATISMLLLTGCGAGSAARGTVRACGTARSAAGVPVHIRVQRGAVSCATAMAVERDYARQIIAGHAPGNGGGGPVTVRGWTCQGFATPVVLNTGKASRCVQGSSEILAILPPPA